MIKKTGENYWGKTNEKLERAIEKETEVVLETIYRFEQQKKNKS